ncbi:MAG TPA: hypothetical protein VFV85_05305, partial [Conexibacter sp.]|nr:hypothetical protein [Conexibacter sp.]
RYARRRRAAVPAALAAFVAMVLASGAHTPLSWAGDPFTPAMTIVLPAQHVTLPPAGVATAEPPGGPVALDDGPSTVATTSGGGGSSSAGGGGDGGDTGAGGGGDTTAGPAVNHVFVVMLSQTDLVALAADRRDAPYFADTLVPHGTLLSGYDAVARGSLANGVALLSGQGPTSRTLADCPTATGAAPADVTPDRLGDDGQQLGDGCVYPFETGTVVDQLTGAGHDWQAYVEDAASACAAIPRDPFAYFHSLLDTGSCARHVAGLDRLDDDLARGSDAPALLWIAPGACHDGQPAPCTAGAPAGPAAADAFLRDVVGRILASAAYADGGLIAITSDEAPQPAPAAAPPATTPTTPAPPPTTPTVPTTPTPTTPTVPTTPTTPTVPAPPPAQTTPTTPTTPAPHAAAPPVAGIAVDPAPAAPVPSTYPNVGDAAAAGAARVGALLISPSVRAGATSDVAANHFTLLRAISDLFALQPLGYAGAADLTPLPEAVLRPNEQ